MSLRKRAARVFASLVAIGSTTVGLATAIAPPSFAAVGDPSGLKVTVPNASTAILSWAPVSRATGYQVQVDNDRSFGSPELKVSTANTYAVPDKQLSGGTQYWRVRAVKGSDTSNWSTGTFTAGAVRVPVPLSPADGAALRQPQDPPLLQWSAVQGAASYTVEVDGDSDFIGAKVYTTKTTNLVVPDPLAQGDFYWRVSAVKSAGLASSPSAPSRFDIVGLPAPVLTSPPNSVDTQVGDVVLDWQPVPGAKSYDLQVATDDSFNTKVEDKTGILGTRFSPATTYDNNQYYWRVRAVDGAGQATPWAAAQFGFKRVWQDTPTVIYPTSVDPFTPTVITDAAPYFQWTPVPKATQYEIYLGTDPQFTNGTFVNCLVAGTTYTPGNFVVTNNGTAAEGDWERCRLTPGRTMYWRVRPYDRPFQKPGSNPGIQGLWSNTQAIRWNPPDLTNVLPANGSTVSVPTLSWTPIINANSYVVKVYDKNNSLVLTDTTYSTSYTPVKKRLTSTMSPYQWTVSAVDAMGEATPTVTRSFSMDPTAPPITGAPSLSDLTPAGTTDTAPALSWEPYCPGGVCADHYKIEMGQNGIWFPATTANVIGQKLYHPSVTDTSMQFLRPGTYEWRVSAYASSGATLSTGSTYTFAVNGFNTVSGMRVAMQGTASDGTQACTASFCDGLPSSPVLSWDKQPGTSYYEIYIAEDANFTNLVETSNSLLATTNSRYALTLDNVRAALPDSQAGQAYFWYVRPCKAPGVCGPSPVSTTPPAGTVKSFRKVAPAVAGLTTSDPNASEVTLSWQDYYDTNQASVWNGQPSYQSGMQYHVQVDDDASFAGSLLDDVLVDQTTYTAFSRLYPDGTLYWRVQAVDAEGNRLTWSPTASFTKSSEAPSLTSPVGGAQVPGTTPFRWAAQPFASQYIVQVYKNGDTTFSSANLMFSKSVKTAAYVWDTPLPASAQPYVWRVRRVDAFGNNGPWSATGRFYSLGGAATLISPLANRWVKTNSSLFVWTEVSGASEYLIEIKSLSSASNLTSTKTTATAFAPTKLLATGNYAWRVTALDNGGNPVGVSADGNFRVDATPPKIKSVGPKTLKPDSTFKITFTERVRGVSKKTVKLLYRRTKKGKPVKVKVKVIVKKKGKVALVDPKGRLRPGYYSLVLNNKRIKDLAGNRLVLPDAATPNFTSFRL